MGKSGKLLTSVVNGVKALKSPSTREKSTKENAHTRKDRDSSVTKHGCMWSFGKSSSRHKTSVGAPQHPSVEVKDVQVQELTQGSQPPASPFHYTDASMDEITSTLVDEIVQEERPHHESYQEDWAAILKLSDEESEPEHDLTHSTQPDEQAAVMIQAAIRRYLAQQSFKRTLEAVIRLQAVARGRTVRKQAAATLRCIHALVKFQANARGRLVRNSEVGQRVRQHLEEIRLQDPMLLEEEIPSEEQNHSQQGASALDEELCTKQSGRLMAFEPDKDHWGWAWLDRWMAARPWENSSSLVVKKKESNRSVDEGAQVIVTNSEKQDESAGFLQENTSIPSANILALHEIPPPPPPPPLPAFIKAANHSIKQPVLCATEESSESASLHTPPTTPVATKESSEGASLCATPTAHAELATPNITRENSPSFNEETSVFSTPVSLEAPLCHAEELEGVTPHGTPVDLGISQAEAANPSIDKPSPAHLGALQAEVVNASIDESSPPASNIQQQSESPSVSSFTTKEEDWWQRNSTPDPLHIIDHSAELGVNKTSVLNNEPVRPISEERTMMGNLPEASKHVDTLEKSASGTRDVSMLGDSEARNIKPEEETEESTKCDVLQGSKDMREGYVQVTGNGLHAPTTLSEEPAKRMGSVLVKHDQQGEPASQRLPSYMATTESSKAKARSQASPRPMPQSPKQRLVSPKHSSGSKRTPTSEGKGAFANPRQIVHVRSGSRGQLASTIKDGSTSSSFRLLGDFKSLTK